MINVEAMLLGRNDQSVFLRAYTLGSQKYYRQNEMSYLIYNIIESKHQEVALRVQEYSTLE